MVITYLGKQFFKITQGDQTISFNPISKESKFYDKGKFAADISLSSTRHPDFNGFEENEYGDKKPFCIDGAGSYEVQDVFIRAFPSKAQIDDTNYINTIYTMTIDGISICFLGALGDTAIEPKVKEAIGDPDVLFVPIHGTNTIGPAKAHSLAVSLEAKVVIPMDFGKDAEKGVLDVFLKEAGAEDVKPVDKITLKKKDIGDKGDVMVLKP
jgi:L-ascorbate metabolism protein UlaG (beta-lactamase superfamily)